ncbi:hypothetical protein PTSG_12136 [Salpingoeca rosetta]|uniref:Uncharacterized protein n=1 Tax=Salpingoeca rosetta (strain ATCC 50818 / BSB-021) TaxID=946362 RepID=F2U6R8_SALR5|nr:uncharacterized protein PTSG_12136 [Salpingoeca rosetta]EGD83550.1 hypothetical protein PTSG_12136 [Salpingoeca rosetta]|eukprot:XP_004995054.1 hypothetical protein PTSG_12136 [Salpingoeca rosetta]
MSFHGKPPATATDLAAWEEQLEALKHVRRASDRLQGQHRRSPKPKQHKKQAPTPAPRQTSHHVKAIISDNHVQNTDIKAGNGPSADAGVLRAVVRQHAFNIVRHNVFVKN